MRNIHLIQMKASEFSLVNNHNHKQIEYYLIYKYYSSTNYYNTHPIFISIFNFHLPMLPDNLVPRAWNDTALFLSEEGTREQVKAQQIGSL